MVDWVNVRKCVYIGDFEGETNGKEKSLRLLQSRDYYSLQVTYREHMAKV